MSAESTTFLGWHGFGLQHPAEWELNVIRGTRKSSYLCLDDGKAARLEMSWKPVPRKMALDKIADSQRQALVKTAKRRKIEIDMKEKASSLEEESSVSLPFRAAISRSCAVFFFPRLITPIASFSISERNFEASQRKI